MKVSIVRRNLLAVAVAAAVQDVRCYLKSVLVEISATETRLVATDGAILAAIRTSAENETTEPFSFMIPVETISRVKSSGSDVISLEIEKDRYALDGVAFSPVDGKFPDYRRVIPKYVNGEPSFFDPELVARFAKIGKTLKAKGSTWIRQNGKNDAAVVLISGFEDFIGVLMPVRETEKAKCPEIPAWPQSCGK